MSTVVTTLSEIPQGDYDDAFALVSQLVLERFPELETRVGPLTDLVLRLSAAHIAAGRVSDVRRLRSSSLLALSQTPELADPELVAAVLSNYGVTLAAAQTAAGPVQLRLSRLTRVVIPAGLEFIAGTTVFRVPVSYAGRLAASEVLTDSDRLVTPQADGTAVMTITVEAVVPGLGGMLRRGTTLVPSRPIANLLSAAAATDFTGGREAQVLADLLPELPSRVASAGWSTPAGVVALLRQCPGLAAAAVSVVGAGAPEQLRDRHAPLPLPISAGNRVDVWLRQPQRFATGAAVLTATYRSGVGPGAVWDVRVPRTILTGATHVVQVLRQGRGIDSAVADLVVTRQYARVTGDPDIVTAFEASNSPFQELLLTFTDQPEDPAPVANVTTAPYLVVAGLLTELPDAQAWLTDVDRRPLFCDVTVRAAVPCRLSLVVQLSRLGPDVLTGQIVEQLADYVNNTGFAGRLYASKLTGLIDPLLPSDIRIRRVRMSGLIYAPDGVVRHIRDDAELIIPNLPEALVTARTVGISLEASDVSFEVTA